MPKQQAIGSRRASMIFAFGNIRWIRPMCRKLFGILSMNRGLALRDRRVSSRYSPPERGDKARAVGELLGPFDLRVRGDDLVDQRGSRAWEPDDEDWLVAR